MTTMTKRLDPHAPSALTPEDYSWVGYTDEGDANSDALRDGPLFPPVDAPGADELRRKANPSRVRNAIHPGGCDACGHQGLRYRHYFRHDPTGDVIVLGDTCVNRMDFDTAEAYASARKVKAQREREEREAVADKWRAANPEVAEALDAYADHHYILGDMARKLRQYGSLSDKQVEFALKLVEETKERLAEKEAEVPFESIPAELNGERVAISGKVLATKWQESDYGGSLKMLVHEARNFKLWGTVPSAINVEKGDEVTFTAKIEVSGDDPTFGFYSRPTKASNLTAEAEGEVEDPEPPATPDEPKRWSIFDGTKPPACEGHPAEDCGPEGEGCAIGEILYCDGSCRR